MAIGLLAGRGLVTVEDGVATLTELGAKMLEWRGISSETAHAFLARAAKFVDVIKIRKEPAEAKAKVLAALTEAKQSLHNALAQSWHPPGARC